MRVSRFIPLFGVALAVACSLFAAEEHKLPKDLQPLADLALSAAPEFAADALLKLAESGRIEDAKAKEDLVQQAFDLAGSAHLRVEMRPVGRLPADTRQGSLAAAYALQLDALSLQSRAVAVMARSNGRRGRDLFSAIALPELKARTCEDALEYDFAGYSQALLAVMQNGFTAKERAKEDHVAFLLGAMGQIRSAAQIAPLRRVIEAAGLTAPQQEAVLVRLNGAEAAIPPAPVCDASASAKAPQATVALGKGNEGTAAKLDAYWQSTASQQLVEEATHLRFGDGAPRVLSDADRATPEWQQRLTDFEKDLAQWGESSESSASDFFHEKCLVYQALVELIPPGPERDKALEAFVQFLGASPLQTQNPAEWFAEGRNMLQRVRNTNGGEPGKVLGAFADSGSPALMLYAAAERMFGGSLPSWVSSQ